MKKRFTEEQIIGVLKEQEAGGKTAEVCRRHGISAPPFYKWKAKQAPGCIRLVGPLRLALATASNFR